MINERKNSLYFILLIHDYKETGHLSLKAKEFIMLH